MSVRKRAPLVAACAFLSFGSLLRAADPAPGSYVQDAPSLLSLDTPLYLDSAPTTTTAPAVPPGPDADRRDQTPAPIDSPPFPMTDWTGPDPLVGFHDTWSPGVFENFLKTTPLNFLMNDLKIHPYGWVDIGGNLSSSRHNNSPDSYDLVPNSVVLDQAVLRLERFVDSYQTDHIDWGVRITGIYGTDYRYTIGKGYLDDQVFKHNELYGGDFVEMFGEVYVPNVFDGLLIKFGRFISPADIEAQLAPQNYLYSHSLMFAVDPYTYTGVNTHWKLNKNWTVELGVDFGNDMAPWVDSESLNGLGMVRWTSDDGNDGLYGGLNAIGAGKYQHGHDDLQQAVCTWGHRFTDKFHMQTELYYMWMYHALEGGNVITGPAQPFAPGGAGTPIKGKADEWGYTCYLEYELDKSNFLTFRPGFLDDMKGQRTGFRTMYTDFTIGISHNFTPWLTFRPEFKYERSWQVPGFDNGTRKNQYVASADLIIWF